MYAEFLRWSTRKMATYVNRVSLPKGTYKGARIMEALEDLTSRKRELEAELRQIDSKYHNEDLPPEAWNRWQLLRLELDAVMKQWTDELANRFYE